MRPPFPPALVSAAVSAATSMLVLQGSSIELVDGSDAAPSLYFENQTDLGLWRPAANQIRMAGTDDDGMFILPRGSETSPSLSFFHTNGNLADMGLRYNPDSEIQIILNDDTRMIFYLNDLIAPFNGQYCWGSDGDPQGGEADTCLTRIRAGVVGGSVRARFFSSSLPDAADCNEATEEGELVYVSGEGLFVCDITAVGGWERVYDAHR